MRRVKSRWLPGAPRSGRPRRFGGAARRRSGEAEERRGRSGPLPTRTRPGRWRRPTAPRGRSPSRPTRGPGSRSTSIPTASASCSRCSATSTCCRSRAARRSASPRGPAYDVAAALQPRRHAAIAFASDRGGIGEPLGLRPRRQERAPGQHARRTGTVNSPAWSPDGEYLVGRKRLTDQLVAGHGRAVDVARARRAGASSSRRRTTSPTPPTPRSRATGASSTSRRATRATSTTATSTRGSGRSSASTAARARRCRSPASSAAPRRRAPSPDGKSLAYVRRVRGQDGARGDGPGERGQVRRLAAGLERDNQEGFAFHGVFPGFAWTPDGRALVATAEGTHRGASTRPTGARAPMPFTAAVEQRVTDAAALPAEARRRHACARASCAGRWSRRTASGSCSPRSATST